MVYTYMDLRKYLDEIDYMIIDYMNNNTNSLHGLCKKLNISRTTLFRRIDKIKKNGFRRRYDICIECLDLGIAYIHIEGEDILKRRIYSISIAGFTLEPLAIYYSFSPYRRVILKYLVPMMYIGLFNDKISESMETDSSISDVFILNQLTTPYFVYGEGEYRINYMDIGYHRKSDVYDYILVYAFLKGYTRLTDISRDFIIPLTTLEYHFREHVKKAIRGRYWIRSNNINVLIELVMGNEVDLEDLINDLYSTGSIDSIISIPYRRFKRIKVLFIEGIVSNFSNLIKYFYELYGSGEIYDVRLFPVYVE